LVYRGAFRGRGLDTCRVRSQGVTSTARGHDAVHHSAVGVRTTRERAGQDDGDSHQDARYEACEKARVGPNRTVSSSHQKKTRKSRVFVKSLYAASTFQENNVGQWPNDSLSSTRTPLDSGIAAVQDTTYAGPQRRPEFP
jgi:hypothetical protein